MLAGVGRALPREADAGRTWQSDKEGWPAAKFLAALAAPVLDVGRTRTGRLWTYVRDDRPFGGTDPPAAVYFYSPDRAGKRPEEHLASWSGLMQADAYAGYNRLYEAGRRPGPIVETACWAHARRKFFDLARLNKTPLAIEAVARIDALFAIEREINGRPPDERRKVRQDRSRPRVEALEAWLREQHARLSSHSQVAKAIAYSLNSWDAFVRFLDDGRLCMSNNAAERALRRVAVVAVTGPSPAPIPAASGPRPSTL